MQTTSISLFNNMVACNCACRYCLLSSCKSAQGVDYFRGKAIAQRFAEWGSGKEFGSIPYYIGHCADYPELLDNIAYNRQQKWIGARFLQCNGIGMKNDAELSEFVLQIKAAGVEMIDTTFFGAPEYHDRFAARKGDYDLMLRLAEIAVRMGLSCYTSLFLCEENRDMLPQLLCTLKEITGGKSVGCALQDYRGHGYRLEEKRLTLASYEALDSSIKPLMNMGRYKTEAQWIEENDWPRNTQRNLIITLREDNIQMFEKLSCDEIAAYVEELDDQYYRALPCHSELAAMYGDPANTRLYRLRDLYWKWQKRYIQEHGLTIYDVTDERYCSTMRS